MITIKSVSHELSLSLQETTHVHNTIDQYAKSPIWNPVYRIRNVFRKFCSQSDWQQSEQILERRIGIYLKNDTQAKRISCYVLDYLLSLSCSNTSSAGVSFAQLMGQEEPVQRNTHTGGLGLHEDDNESFQSICTEEAEDNFEELLIRRRNAEQMQMNYGFMHSPYYT
ncbi:MAG: hypothetical protein ACI9S8_002967 [Chlamydiales bacterium]|jgi:hypothetical protein